MRIVDFVKAHWLIPTIILFFVGAGVVGWLVVHLALEKKEWADAALAGATYALVAVTAVYVVVTGQLVRVTARAQQQQAIFQLRSLAEDAQIISLQIGGTWRTLEVSQDLSLIESVTNQYSTQLQQAEMQLRVLAVNVPSRVAGIAAETAGRLSRAAQAMKALNVSVRDAKLDKEQATKLPDVERSYDKIRQAITSLPKWTELLSGELLDQVAQGCKQLIEASRVD